MNKCFPSNKIFDTLYINGHRRNEIWQDNNLMRLRICTKRNKGVSFEIVNYNTNAVLMERLVLSEYHRDIDKRMQICWSSSIYTMNCNQDQLS